MSKSYKKMKRKLHREIFIRKVFLCYILHLGRHKWGGYYPAEVGPTGGDDDEFVTIGEFSQCDRCWTVRTLN